MNRASGLGHNQCHRARIIGPSGFAEDLAGLANPGKTLAQPAVKNFPFAGAASYAGLVIGQGAIGTIDDSAAGLVRTASADCFAGIAFAVLLPAEWVSFAAFAPEVDCACLSCAAQPERAVPVMVRLITKHTRTTVCGCITVPPIDQRRLSIGSRRSLDVSITG
jgi:hypothetical protein